MIITNLCKWDNAYKKLYISPYMPVNGQSYFWFISLHQRGSGWPGWNSSSEVRDLKHLHSFTKALYVVSVKIARLLKLHIPRCYTAFDFKHSCLLKQSSVVSPFMQNVDSIIFFWCMNFIFPNTYTLSILASITVAQPLSSPVTSCWVAIIQWRKKEKKADTLVMGCYSWANNVFMLIFYESINSSKKTNNLAK